ncbi:hypothetical protein [Paenibacillus sp. MMO-177]|uniref:hypothetical protein n=1 Tax=Paenibacillus sp. MMO-177 TaxID=3081289 RepID=UPI003018BD3B
MYTYVHNNPLIYWDPTGHWIESDKSLNVEDQAAIIAYTNAYYNATTDAVKQAASAGAQAIRDTAKTEKASGTYNQNVVSPLQFQTSQIKKSCKHGCRTARVYDE